MTIHETEITMHKCYIMCVYVHTLVVHDELLKLTPLVVRN